MATEQARLWPALELTTTSTREVPVTPIATWQECSGPTVGPSDRIASCAPIRSERPPPGMTASPMVSWTQTRTVSPGVASSHVQVRGTSESFSPAPSPAGSRPAW